MLACNGEPVILPIIDDPYLMRHDNLIQISVEDTGIGLRKEDLEPILVPLIKWKIQRAADTWGPDWACPCPDS
jgi:hypothetical protein